MAIPATCRPPATPRGPDSGSGPGGFRNRDTQAHTALASGQRTPPPTHVCGPPAFDELGFYLGPLPKKPGGQLIGKEGGQFRTSAAAAWPPALCEWVARQFLTSFLRNSEAGKDQKRKRPSEDGEDEGGKRARIGQQDEVLGEEAEERTEDDVDPFLPPCLGGKGRARGCKGQEVPFHDGGCLLSPGRWGRKVRWHPGGDNWQSLRERMREAVTKRAGGEAMLERECFSMARGSGGCVLAQDEGLLEELRGIVAEATGQGEEKMAASPGQPFRLDLMKGILAMAGDGDYEFLEEAKEGFTVGVKYPMPRTPAAFERQVEWALQDDPTGGYALEKANYPSAGEHEEHLRAHLEDEVEEGLVEKMDRETFRGTFGDDRAISALAVLVEDEVTGKKRVIHDASHEVRVNHRIKCQDKLRMPGGREKRFLLAQFEEERAVVFSLIGDFGKAHRRFKYRRDEQGYLGCAVNSSEDWVYVNKVGTFGVASTPYWWGRLSGALVRIAHYLLGPEIPIELLLYADDLEGLGIGPEGRKGYLAALGSPFKWGKQRGGLTTEWIGLTTDYGSYSFGLSERRARWMTDWIGRLLKEKEVPPREFAAVMGRLSFASSALPWEKPFLGPLYTWSAAVRDQHGRVVVPWAVLVILECH